MNAQLLSIQDWFIYCLVANRLFTELYQTASNHGTFPIALSPRVTTPHTPLSRPRCPDTPNHAPTTHSPSPTRTNTTPQPISTITHYLYALQCVTHNYRSATPATTSHPPLPHVH